MKLTTYVLAVLCLLLACQKEPGETIEEKPEPPLAAGTAEFKFLVINGGTLRAGDGEAFQDQPTTDGDWLRFSVTVTRPGTWTAYSDTSNGYYFVGTGSFSTSGETDILVRAYGKPVNGGTTKFNLYAGGDSTEFLTFVFPPSGVSGPLTNRLPQTNAGVDQLLSLPDNSIVLHGSAIDGDGQVASLQWQRISGPGSPSLSNTNTSSLKIDNLVQGAHLFELKATDKLGASTKDTVQVTIQPPQYAVFALPHCMFDICACNLQDGTPVLGSPAAASHFVWITVDVKKTGHWELSTSTKNGLRYAGNGDFTVTGLQTIKLMASGTPTAAGLHSIPLTQFPHCKIDINVLATPNNATAPYYYKARIGGVDYEAFAGATGNTYMAGSGKSEFNNTASFSADISPEPPLPDRKSLQVTKGVINNYSSTTSNQFSMFFGQGSYPYMTGAPGTAVQEGAGIKIIWVDEEGKTWSTNFGTRDQSGSTFTILSKSDEPDPAGKLYVKVKCIFTCKLYKEGTGEMKVLENGEFVGLFGKL